MSLGRRIRSLQLGLTTRFRRHRRTRLARRYLHGSGVEIGALHLPLDLPAGVDVRYVDRMSTPDLRREYPELAELPIVDVAIVDDGEVLGAVEDGSIDFVVANHVIEHCEDPVGTVGNWLQRLRPGGVIFMAVPHRKRTFDSHREPTSIEHLLRDHRDGADASRLGHYREWVDSDGSQDKEDEAERLLGRRENIHFHVWTPGEFRTVFFNACEAEGLAIELVTIKGNLREFVAIARKSG